MKAHKSRTQGLENIKRFTRLQVLLLKGTKVTDAGIENLMGSSIQVLRLEGTRVGDAGLAKLNGLTKLDWLVLMETQISKTLPDWYTSKN